MVNDRDPRADDLAALLGDLRTTLDELERTLDADRTGGADRDERRRNSRGPAPPSGSDVVRFTEEYTIPTVISILETTIESLELLRGVLRLVDPDRRLPRDESERRPSGVDRVVVDGAERALEDLRRALAGTEEPSDPVARDVLGDARALTREIESLVAEARDGPDRSRPPRRSDDGSRSGRRGVVIPVDDEEPEEGEPDGADDRGPTVDVDAELESIRDEVRRESGDGSPKNGADGTAGAVDEERGEPDEERRDDGSGDDGR